MGWQFCFCSISASMINHSVNNLCFAVLKLQLLTESKHFMKYYVNTLTETIVNKHWISNNFTEKSHNAITASHVKWAYRGFGSSWCDPNELYHTLGSFQCCIL